MLRFSEPLRISVQVFFVLCVFYSTEGSIFTEKFRNSDPAPYTEYFIEPIESERPLNPFGESIPGFSLNPHYSYSKSSFSNFQNQKVANANLNYQSNRLRPSYPSVSAYKEYPIDQNKEFGIGKKNLDQTIDQAENRPLLLPTQSKFSFHQTMPKSRKNEIVPLMNRASHTMYSTDTVRLHSLLKSAAPARSYSASLQPTCLENYNPTYLLSVEDTRINCQLACYQSISIQNKLQSCWESCNSGEYSQCQKISVSAGLELENQQHCNYLCFKNFIYSIVV
ncbi:uncharacterized protein LOC111713488 [Eurytemora carolleeae]|uniref:uncharacterized protein LOC111713488 n=1 Tax=Eurytemora carolleeae TaxID=1294199 RepID=UPI000C779CE3|nr:uncharacterized protein LOC111713488 [Eurytemora carolleeae]|eukprot:XP_023344120.1 uncharacterized protein LOC111713488 [Eurytemora affinis]